MLQTVQILYLDLLLPLLEEVLVDIMAPGLQVVLVVVVDMITPLAALEHQDKEMLVVVGTRPTFVVVAVVVKMLLVVMPEQPQEATVVPE
jgi:hypothetical protein